MSKRFGILAFLFLIYPYFCLGQPDKLLTSHTDNPPYIIIKLKNFGSVQKKEIQLSGVKESFEIRKILSRNKNKGRLISSENGLDGYYKLSLSDEGITPGLLKALKRSGEIELIEPYRDYELLYIPNDPEASESTGAQSPYLSNIQAYEAWDIHQNAEEILIAIIDTGVDTGHVDLKSNHFLNTDDHVNGIDDDLDGYTDNYYGWDFADSDYDIYADRDPHGTQVAGISSAVTDNEIGIAGTGFNTRFLPLKIFSSADNEFYNGFEAVLYAAEMGSDIIVLSWGSAGSYSEYARDIIKYVIEELDVVIVAAAGNTSDELDYYPASYPNVLSVGSVDENDELSSWATYSHYIDIMAQGDAIYTTHNDDQFISSQGSSYSAPQVAGAAALLRSAFPEWNALQIMEQLRVTADDIYQIGSNQSYAEKLGKGRLNMYRALTDSMTRSVRMVSFDYDNGLGQYVFFEDSTFLYPDFQNILGPVDNLTIKISSLNPHVTVIDSILISGTLGPLDSLIPEGPIRFYSDNNLGYNEKIKFRLDLKADNYSDYQYFEIYSSGSVIDFSNGQITTSISDNGSIGYSGNLFENGSGWVFNQQQLIKNAGIIFSTDIDHVADNMVTDPNQQSRQDDFIAKNKIKLFKNSVAEYDARSQFEEKSELPDKLNILIEQKILTDSINPYMIYEYRIINNNPDTIFGFSAGMFVDWDLGVPEENMADWIAADTLGYVYNNDNNIFAGISVVGSGELSYYALDLDNKNGNIADINGQVTDSIKHAIISSGTSNKTAGENGLGNDVGHAIGIRMDTMPEYTASKIAFVLISSDNMDNLKAYLEKAKEFYKTYISSPPEEYVVKICENEDAVLNPESGDMFEFYSDPFMNNLIKTDSVLELQGVNQDTAVYIVNVDHVYSGDIRKVPVTIERPVAGFFIPDDTLVIPPGENRKIKFSNQSSGSVSWTWNFGNGYGSILKNPETFYSEEDEYEITLVSISSQGCADTVSQFLSVIRQNEIPDVQDMIAICRGEEISIQAQNTDSINIYTDTAKTNRVYTGGIFQSGPIYKDTVFWITNADGLYESELVMIKVKQTGLNARIYYSIDTSDLSTVTKLNLTDSSASGFDRYWYVNNTEVSSDDKFSFDYREYTYFTVKIISMDTMNCTDSASILFTPDISVKPEFENYFLCKNQQASIRSRDSAVLAVYSDSIRENLIYKGRSFTSQPLSDDIKYYITSLNDLLESEPVEVDIRLSEIPADFIMHPDSLYLDQGNTVVFTAQNEAEHYQWEFELAGSDTLREVNRQFFDPGNYEVSLEVVDSLGCVDSENKVLRVFSIVGVEDNFFTIGKIFPNPANRYFKLQLDDNSKREIDLIFTDLQGRILKKQHSMIYKDGIELTTDLLGQGLYLLKVIDGENKYVFRLIIQ